MNFILIQTIHPVPAHVDMSNVIRHPLQLNFVSLAQE